MMPAGKGNLPLRGERLQEIAGFFPFFLIFQERTNWKRRVI
jgi:hypothetical protein